MHKTNLIKSAALLAAFGVAASGSAQLVDIARWSFTATVAPPDNTPTATTIKTTAFATQLNMSNNYTDSLGNTFSVASCDVLYTPPPTDPNPISTGYTWRIRGNGSGGGNGWNLSAPQWTQGAEFDVSTVGYNGVVIQFDWYCTAQGIAELALQYNLNINNPNGWVSYKGRYNGNQVTEPGTDGATLLVAQSKTYNTVGCNVVNNVADLTLIPGVANNPNFGIRFVSAWDPTAGTYLGASGGTYNNNSGNWRFDQIAIQGYQAANGTTTGSRGPGFTVSHH